MAVKLDDTSKNQENKKHFKDVWSGVGFSLCGHTLVAPMGEVIEIAPVPKYTFVPGTKPWVMGVANVRGKLLPIIDMERFFGSKLLGSRNNYRVLIVEINKIYVGLIVSKVFGLKHFENNAFTAPNKNRKEVYGKFIDAEYADGENVWSRLLPSMLVGDAEFSDASILRLNTDAEVKSAVA